MAVIIALLIGLMAGAFFGVIGIAIFFAADMDERGKEDVGREDKMHY